MVTKKLLSGANQLVSMMPFVDTIEISDDLSLVTDIGEEAPLECLGLSENCSANIQDAMESLYRTRLHNHIALCVRREGEIIFNRSMGMAQGQLGEESAIAGSVDTPACLFSGSKAISAMLLCKFEELGELSLDDKIRTYIPKFARSGKHDITLGELISHRAQIPTIEISDPRDFTDHDFVLDQLCHAPPSGDKQAYHAISGGFIIAEVIEKITGQPISKALNTYFRKPLGMKYFTFGLQKRYRNKRAVNHVAGIPLIYPMSKIPHSILGMNIGAAVEMSNSDYFLDAVLPAGNIYATAEEASRFYQMLLDDGCYNGNQILHPDTIEKARSGNRLPSWDSTFNIPAHFSQGGFMLNAPPTWIYGINAPEAFGHLGFINTLTWADPQRQISVGLTTSGKPFLGPHLLNFANIPNTINSNCPKL